MATKKNVQDKFSNIASISVLESAANTLTYKKLETGVSMFEKYAWIINRIEYFFPVDAAVFNATTDTLALALMANNVRATILTAATFQDMSVLDMIWISRQDYGAAASGGMNVLPLVKDFSQLPGGGLIVPPAPLYGAAQGTGLVSASQSVIKIYYTVLELAADEYWELVEARRLLSA